MSEETLKGMHKVMAGKPYIVTSFVDDVTQGEIISLYSKTRTFEEIRKALNDPYGLGPGKAKSVKTILKSNDSKSPEAKKAHIFTETLFSGNQILDMLVGLAIDQPALFKKFFVDGKALLDQTAKAISTGTEKQKIFFNQYFSALDKFFEGDLLSHITYAQHGTGDRLRQAFELIQDRVNSNTTLTKEALKTEVLDKLKGNKA